MPAEIVPLRCPSCGNSCSVRPTDKHFGLQFKCEFCGAQSVVVTDQNRDDLMRDECVCARCGRIARLGSRVCQCGASLVQSCNLCGSEFPIGDSICDHCGAESAGDALDFDAFLDDVLRKKPDTDTM